MDIVVFAVASVVAVGGALGVVLSRNPVHSALMLVMTLFFGGPSGPVYSFLPRTLWPILWFFLKLLVFLFAYVWMRASVPRFRYDQLMDLGWKRLIPAALFWLLLIAAIQVGRDQGWNPTLVLGVGVVAGLAVLGALALAMRTSRLRADDDSWPVEASR